MHSCTSIVFMRPPCHHATVGMLPTPQAQVPPHPIPHELIDTHAPPGLIDMNTPPGSLTHTRLQGSYLCQHIGVNAFTSAHMRKHCLKIANLSIHSINQLRVSHIRLTMLLYMFPQIVANQCGRGILLFKEHTGAIASPYIQNTSLHVG